MEKTVVSVDQHVSSTLLETDADDDDDKKQSTANIQKPSLLFSKRFFITSLLFLSNVTMTLIESNMNIVVIEMTSFKNVTIGNLTIAQPPEFPWDSKKVALILSTTAYGRLMSFLSAPLISKFGGSTSWALSMMLAGITTLLHPIGLSYNFYVFLVCRFLIGVFDSFYNASTIESCSRWIPKSERGTLVSVCLNGLYVGIAIAHPVCGFTASEWGWRTTFYITGAICLMLSLICLILVRNRPSEDRWISKKELSYILKETDIVCAKKVITRPYRTIFTSAAIWALCTGYFASSWIVNTLLACLPLFIKDMTQKNTKDVAFLSSIPSVTGIFISLVAGTLLDYWKNNSTVTLTRMHKIIIGTAYTSQMVLFFILTFVDDLASTMILFVLIRVFLPFGFLILRLISITIAPNHTAIVASVVTFWFSFSRIANQMVTGFLTVNHTMEEWDRCFYLTAVILMFGAIIFVSYGSSEAQPWSLSSNLQNQPNSDDKTQSELIKK